MVFRTYLTGLLMLRDRLKTLTALVGAEPLGTRPKRLKYSGCSFFLSEVVWDAETINAKRLSLLADEPAAVPSAAGVLVIDGDQGSQGWLRHRSRGAPVPGIGGENQQRHRGGDHTVG